MEELIKALASGLEEYSLQIASKNREKILAHFASLCDKYEQTPEDFVESWMAFAATGGIAEMEEANLDRFEKQELSKEKDKSEKSTVNIRLTSSTLLDSKAEGRGRSSPAVVDLDMDCDNLDEIEDEDSSVLAAYGLKPVTSTYAGTPKSEKKSARPRLRPAGETPLAEFSPAGYSPAIGSASVSYALRTKSGDSVLHYKCKDSDYWNDMPGTQPPVKISPSQGTAKLLGSGTSLKYMFQTATAMTATLSAALSETGYAILDKDDDPDKELQDLRTSSTENCWYFGRIRTEEGRLSQGNIYLEGDMDISGGHTVSLDLSQAEEYRLFPGQAVLIQGKNELGKCLRVSEVLTPGGLPPMTELIPANVSPLNIIVACGPYSPTDSLLYEPFKDLIEVVKKDKPDLCILLGPFIDPGHPMIAAGEVADTFEDLFEDLINHLKKALKDVQTHVVLISSFKDAHHHHVYPSPPYSMEAAPKMSFYPDPSVFEVSGITFGVTSTDILKHLANNELAKSTITDRMGGLSKLILSQGSLYPLYPPDESVPLDLALWRKYCKLGNTPQILIMPSDLRHFIKDVDGTIVVNPERLTKGKSGGTYARLQIKLPERIGGGERTSSSVADFCCGEIIKI